MQVWHEIGKQISVVTGSFFEVKKAHAIGGGCINQTYYIADGIQRYFVKLNTPGSLAMFEAEAAGLMEIHRSHTLRVPVPVCAGQDNHAAWLILEYLDINKGKHGKASDLGQQLAAMHRTTCSQFGWIRDNTIGQNPQLNTISSDWVDFWRTHRLGYQLDLAGIKGYNGKLQRLGEQLLIDMDNFFPNVMPSPSLLHGDLWGGNYAYDESGSPVLFDPAVYYGDRETDIAMTELFGGFSADFYSAYHCEYPLDSGYNIRKVFYNLYHVLNHLNLFGGGYRYQAEQMMSSLLAQIR